MNKSIKITLKAFKLLFKECPNLFISNGLYQIVNSVIPYVAIFLSAQIIEELAGSRNPETVWFWVYVTIVSTAVFATLNGVLKRWANVYNWDVIYMNTCNLYRRKTLEMDFAVADRQSTRDLLTQINQAQHYRSYGIVKVYSIYIDFISSFISIISSFVLVFTLFTSKVNSENLTFLNNPIFIIVVISIILLSIFLSSKCTVKADDMIAKASKKAMFGNALYGFFGFMVHNKDRALDMRMYSQENVIENYLEEFNMFSPDSELGKVYEGMYGILHSVSAVITSVLTGFIYIFVCLKSLGGAFGVGLVTQYIGALTLLTGGINKLATTFGTIKNNAGFIETAFEYLEMPNEMYEGSLTTEKRSDKNYEIEFRNVSFKYPNTEELVLKNLNVKFKVGKKFAVVGENGSGKTTFIKLLCRLYDPTEGEILLNGINIKKYDYKDYIDIFSVVFQDFKLLAYSLAQNVATNVNFDKEKVRKCLENSGFEQRLKTLEKGIDTKLYKDLDKNGVEISGGEAQKIALARALYKDSAFIILDEPTAALDPIAESEVYESFNNIVGDKTTIYISHRLSSCKFCDEIMVFNKGKITEFGTHQNLLNQNGKYNQLWHAQAQYYNWVFSLYK